MPRSQEYKIQAIKELEQLYGNEFDYSQSVYTTFDSNIKIIHKETGIMFQQPYNLHKKGLRPRTNLNYAFILYILKCKEKYGNRYNFQIIKVIINLLIF